MFETGQRVTQFSARMARECSLRGSYMTVARICKIVGQLNCGAVRAKQFCVCEYVFLSCFFFSNELFLHVFCTGICLKSTSQPLPQKRREQRGEKRWAVLRNEQRDECPGYEHSFST